MAVIGPIGGLSGVMYKVVLSRQARRYYSSVDTDTVRRLNDVFEVLESNPRPIASKPLKGELQGFNRVRVGHLRVIYRLDEPSQEVRIVRIGPRGDIYRS
jgi:mRNA interferase RelE/StbE